MEMPQLAQNKQLKAHGVLSKEDNFSPYLSWVSYE